MRLYDISSHCLYYQDGKYLIVKDPNKPTVCLYDIPSHCLYYQDGKYLIVKDLNKPTLRLYDIPLLFILS